MLVRLFYFLLKDLTTIILRGAKMKKALLSIVLTSAVAAPAYAQSSLTLYGSLGAAVIYTNNQTGKDQAGHPNWQIGSGGAGSNYWGLRGAEDLGAGTKAIFLLESGFKINNGRFPLKGVGFDRQSFIGLSDSRTGTITLGRQYDSLTDYLATFSLAGSSLGGGQFSHPFDNDNLNSAFSVNNAIKFSSIDYNGFTFGGLYGFSNEAGKFANNRNYSLGAAYNYGPFGAAIGYLQAHNAGANNTGAEMADESNLAADRQRIWGAGASYMFGPTTVGFVFTQAKFDRPSNDEIGEKLNIPDRPLLGNYAHFNNYELNARYRITPAWSVNGAYTFSTGKFSLFQDTSALKAKWHQASLLTSYALSKRTNVFISAVAQQSQIRDSQLSLTNINGFNPSTTNRQMAITTGLRMKF